MAARQEIAPGFPFPIYVNETATRQEIAPGVYVDETVPATAAPNYDPRVRLAYLEF
jgi:hypothetical protein